MHFPFVSRERFNDERAEVARLRSEVEKERAHNQRLWNFLNWRVGGGVAFDTALLPEAYQPRAAAVAQDAVREEGKPKSSQPVKLASWQARGKIGEFEADRENAFERAVVPQANITPPAGQIAVVRELHRAANEAQQAVS